MLLTNNEHHHNFKYLQWLFYRQYDETCDDDQLLFGAEFPVIAGNKEVVIFDEGGNEIFDLKRSAYLKSNISMNLCLHRNTTYFVTSFDATFRYSPLATYFIDGEVVNTVNSNEIIQRAEIFPLLSLVRNASPQSNSILKTYEAPMSGCISTNRALLEVEGLDGIESVTLCDMAGEAKGLSTVLNSMKAQCVPRNNYFALLLCSRDSNSSNYTVLVDGTPRATIDGPFYDPFPNIPRCILIQLTPALLAEESMDILSVPPSHVPSLSPISSVPTITAVSANPSSDPQPMQEPSTESPTSGSFRWQRFVGLPILAALHLLCA